MSDLLELLVLGWVIQLGGCYRIRG